MMKFITCERAVSLFSDYLDGELGSGQVLLLRLHLPLCPGCRAVLATMRVLPALAAQADQESPEAALAALEGALARIREGGPRRRPWAPTPVPEEARSLLGSGADLPLSILAAAHQALVAGPDPAAGPYPLPKGILDQLPPADQWRWTEGEAGRRRAELLAVPGGPRLVLAYAPGGTPSTAHRHLGSESVLVLAGTLLDGGRALAPGAWVHHGAGSVHAPEAGEACWCLIREEGEVEAAKLEG